MTTARADVTPVIGQRGWSLYPAAALRSSGFSFSCWESLLPPGLRALLSPVERAWDAALRYRGHLTGTVFPEAVSGTEDRQTLRVLSRSRAAVGRQRPVRTLPAPDDVQVALRNWNARLHDVELATGALGRSFDDELLVARRRLHELAASAPLAEAIGMLSPSFATSLASYADRPLPVIATSHQRGVERRLMLYLQRLIAKNETNSFFGPVGHAEINPAAPEALRVLGAPGCGPPQVFSSPRVAHGLAELIRTDPEMAGHIAVRHSPLFGLVDGKLTYLPTGRVMAADPDLVTAWRDAGVMPEADNALVRLGALVHQVPGDPWTAEPLDSLESWLAGLPQTAAVRTHRRRVLDVGAAIRSYAQAPAGQRPAALPGLERRIAELTGLPQRRGRGAMYADRGLVFEERENRMSLTVGGATAAGLADELAPVLTYWAASACQRWRLRQRQAAEFYDRFWPNRTEVPLPAYLAKTAGLPAAEAPTPAESQVAGLLATGTSEVALPAERLNALLPEIDGPVFTSIDLMVAAASVDTAAHGDLRWVIGEAHAAHLLSAFPTDHFARQRDPRASARRDTWLVETLRGTGHRVVWLVTRRDSKIFQYPLPAVTAQLRPHLPDNAALPASRLTVRRTADGVMLHDAEGPLRLLPAVHRTVGTFDPLAPLSFPAVESLPFGRGARRPRVVVGRTVAQRATWQVNPPALTHLHGIDQFLAARNFRREHGMPELVFVRLPAEPKPTLLDFRNPLSVDAFTGLLRRQSEKDREIVATFTEMLPGPNDIWLPGHRTFELRILAVH